MMIGLTYDLRDEYLQEGWTEEEVAELDAAETILAIEDTLQQLGYRTERIGRISSLVGRLAEGKTWDLVFNICEGIHGISRESQVPALLEAYRIPYTFSDPLVLAATLHKGIAKRIVRDMGVPTPEFAVIESTEDIDSVRLPYPLFAKPAAEGTSRGITAQSKIDSPKQLRPVCSQLLETYRQPVLVEKYLPGKEYTIGIVGTGKEAQVIGMAEVLYTGAAEQNIYSFHNKMNYDTAMKYRYPETPVAEACAELALRVWRGLGCRDGGRVDLRENENGVLQFLEVNPLAGLRPVSSLLPIVCEMNGVSYKELIRLMVESALRRVTTR